jgi:hypothetical protein
VFDLFLLRINKAEANKTTNWLLFKLVLPIKLDNKLISQSDAKPTLNNSKIRQGQAKIDPKVSG